MPDHPDAAQTGSRPLRPDTGDGRSLTCTRCGVTTPDASFCDRCGLPHCDNCLTACTQED
jgi:late competence protein required for DNA uptake (superfamily II DNA/RNA helicase)